MKSSFLRLIALIVVSLILTILPLPKFWMIFQPLWVALFILYIQLMQPPLFRLSLIMLLGFSIDVMTSSVMGQHVLALIMMTWLASSRAKRFRFFSFVEQMLCVFILLCIYQTCMWATNLYIGYHMTWLVWFCPIITSVILWPFLSNFFYTYLTRRT